MKRAPFATVLISVLVAIANAQPIPIAVLGDSDSQSYRDDVYGVRRGGDYHAAAFNWLELWVRLSPEEVDPGPFVSAGDPAALANLKAVLGVASRSPRKRDYLFNYAVSGAGCDSLRRSWPEQARWLKARLKAEKNKWEHGLVVIRIGVNDFGQISHLREWAANPVAAAAPISRCLEEISRTIEEVRAVSPVRIALVGVAHDYEMTQTGGAIVDAAEIESVHAALNSFDAGLKDMADQHRNVAFVDDHSWYTSRFGSRRTGGARMSAEIAGVFVVNRSGDAPTNLHLADGHAGTIESGLFLQGLIDRLNERFGWELTRPTDARIVAAATTNRELP